MTWNEIENLQLTPELINQLGFQNDPMDGSLEAAFLNYKNQLKKQNLKDRLDALADIRLAMVALNVNVANSEIYKKSLVDSLANNQVSLLEDSYAEEVVRVAAIAEEENAIKEGLRKINIGNQVIAFINYLNSQKQLSGEQVAQLVSTYSQIISLLSTGSIATALGVINSITPDGVVMTLSDKNKIIALIARLNPN